MKAIAYLIVALAAPSLASAHEFWLRPDTFTPALGDEVAIRLFVGDGFENGEPYPRNPRHLRSFTLVGETVRPIPGRTGLDPAGRVVADAAGTLVAAYRSGSTELVLDAERFEAYLEEEGLQRIAALRAAAGDSDGPGREGFSRCAKALVRVADEASGYDRVVGLDLEIVPSIDPFTLPHGRPLPIRVLWRGAPLPGAQLRVFREGDPDATYEQRTDEDGTASLALSGPGVFMLSVVHMEAAPENAGVDWISTWSSLTFELLH